MKPFKLVFYCIFLLIFIAGCKKDGAEKNGDIRSLLTGTWELRQTSGGMMPGIANHLPGNGNILKFTDTDYKVYAKGQQVKKGHYTIVADSTIEQSVCLVFPSGQFSNRIVYDGNQGENKMFLQIINNRLTFISGCYAYDAGSSTEYDRLQDGVR